MTLDILATGRFTRLVSKDGWEFVERTNASGIVIIVAVTPAGELLLVEQHRAPVDARVIELPAGLSGDIAGEEDEALEVAALRELEEETGWRAAEVRRVVEGPLSAGLSSEVVSFFLARDLVRIGEGGGDDSEDITVHAVPLAEVPAWIARRTAEPGVLVDPKVYAALWFAKRDG
ncbi:MAG: DNA mismatch repair protein MutT [Proteobacteria bacterium]|nr:MAG: DNA mismatch repair protein MutT [Pseudomonadota bacterium]